MHRLFMGLVVLSLAAAATAAESPSKAAKRPAEQQLPRLSSPQLLNHWGLQPDHVQRLFEACYRVLAAHPAATFGDVAADAAVQRLCEEHGIRHLGGPLLGDVTPAGAKIWLRTCRPAQVEVRVAVDGSERVFGPVASTVDSDLAAVVPVSGLKPGTRYPYRVLVDGARLAAPAHAAIATPLAEPNPASVRIAFGTCSHRFGLGNQRQAEAIRGRQPAAMLLYGDVAVQDRNNHLGLHRADYLLRDFFPAWQGLAAAVPVYAGWDDHDYFDNDKYGIPKGYTPIDRAGVRDVFRRSWSNPSYGFGDERGGVFFRARIGPCDVIVTDGRSFREKGDFLGRDQMQWLEAQLLDCRGPFIILASSTMWSDYVSNGKDSWGVYDPEGRERVFRLIEKNRIGGVLLISGDRHGARGFRIPRPSQFNFYEFEPASLGGITWGPKALVPGCAEQLFGYLGYAFGEFTIDARLPDPTVTFRLIGEDGGVIYELTLSRSQLTPKGETGR
ncbi:MAG: alkaline phosphatase family protein [Candidatus Anammoximicrobium sp.]|nr:alkaline phosphatase family protein [Candidatus Anammoximicrobium sp.]